MAEKLQAKADYLWGQAVVVIPANAGIQKRLIATPGSGFPLSRE
jgi:hypothetical protein